MQPDLFDTPKAVLQRAIYAAERDRVLAKLAQKAGKAFREAAGAHILSELEKWPLGRPGEALTLSCREAGIAPARNLDDRAFGPVFMALAKAGAIVKVGTAKRVRGHGTAGGNVWALKGAAK